MKGITQQAQQILQVRAQEEAKRFRSAQLHPEHIMLAILHEHDSLVSKVLSEASIKSSVLGHQLETVLEDGNEKITLGDVPPSNRGKQVIEHSAEEARALGNEYIGIEHLLLACFSEPESVSAHCLGDVRGSIEVLRGIVKRFQGPVQQNLYQTSKSSSQGQPRRGAVYGMGKKTTPTLDEFSIDLTDLARQKKLDPVLGRDTEIRKIMRVLIRRNKNSPLLVGEPGIGKTAIIEGLAQRIADQAVPELLRNKRVLSLDLARLIAGTKYRGEFEERMKRVMKEIKTGSDIILFIDEIHTIIGAGGAEGAIDASNMIKPALSRREIQCAGATTLAEYKKYIEKDSALERRFQPIQVEEPSVEETIDILDGIKSLYEKHHKVKYHHGAIHAAAVLSKRYITERNLPDKAIDVIDEAGSKKRLSDKSEPSDVQRLEKDISKLNAEKIALVSAQDYEKAALIRDEVLRIRIEIDSLKNIWNASAQNTWQEVSEDDIYDVVSSVTGIPLSRLAMTESQKLLRIEEELHKTVIGQEQAVASIAAAIRKSRAGLNKAHRPIGSFLFLGPTGVGKTLLGKTLAQYLFGSSDALIRLDMSDFMERHTVSRLVGAPPGYVGYEEGGFLTEKIRRRPYSVILFDEIEKAHRDVYNILLQVLEEGELQDNLGHKVSFHNTILIMTSNVGSEALFRGKVGFSQEGRDDPLFASTEELSRTFRPEFLNRLDEIVHFSTLTEPQVYSILDLLVAEIQEQLNDSHITLKLTKRLRKHLITRGYSKQFGARNIRRLIAKELEDRLSMGLLEGSIPPHSTVVFTLKGNEVHFSIASTPSTVPVAQSGNNSLTR